MKAKLQNILGLVALGVTLLALTVPTWAGYVSNREVIVADNQYFSYGSGSMVDARYSADSRQYIGCHLEWYDDRRPLIECYARDSTGEHSLSCRSEDPTHVAELQGMTASSYIYFSVNSNNGPCNLIVITNSSDMLR